MITGESDVRPSVAGGMRPERDRPVRGLRRKPSLSRSRRLSVRRRNGSLSVHPQHRRPARCPPLLHEIHNTTSWRSTCATHSPTRHSLGSPVPAIAGEERTRDVFGDYVSVYNFAASVADHATVPLYYENRSPLQIANPTFGDDLMAIVEEADLGEAQDQAIGAGTRAAIQVDHPRRPPRCRCQGHRRPLPRARFRGESPCRLVAVAPSPASARSAALVGEDRAY